MCKMNGIHTNKVIHVGSVASEVGMGSLYELRKANNQSLVNRASGIHRRFSICLKRQGTLNNERDLAI